MHKLDRITHGLAGSCRRLRYGFSSLVIDADLRVSDREGLLDVLAQSEIEKQILAVVDWLRMRRKVVRGAGGIENSVYARLDFRTRWICGLSWHDQGFVRWSPTGSLAGFLWCAGGVSFLMPTFYEMY